MVLFYRGKKSWRLLFLPILLWLLLLSGGIRSNLSEFSIKALLFAIIIVILTLKGDFSIGMQKNEGMVSMIFVFIYSFLNTGLIISSVINFLPQTSKLTIISSSNLAATVMNYSTAWIVLPALLMIVGGFLTSRAQAAAEGGG